MYYVFYWYIEGYDFPILALCVVQGEQQWGGGGQDSQVRGYQEPKEKEQDGNAIRRKNFRSKGSVRRDSR